MWIDRSGMPAHRKLKMDFICSGDPLDVRTWSGTPFHMLKALEREFEVGLVVRRPLGRWFPYFRRALRRLTFGKIDLYWSPAWARRFSREAVRELARSDSDVIFVVAATPICAELTATGRRTVFVSDATLSAMLNYNPRNSAMTPGLKLSAARLETTSISRSIAAFFPSKWARNSAIRNHDASPERAFQVPWGTNLVAEDVRRPEEKSLTEWRILFVGVDWAGKGGDIVLKTVEIIRDRGHSVHLDIVGCAPHLPPPKIEGVTFHGFLNKSDPDDRDRLTDLFRNAHLLMLPTQFEALGIVVAEAASFGVPAIAYDTGGVSANFEPGVTGILLDVSAGPQDFASAMIDLLGREQSYLAMAHAAIDHSRNKLNWPAWAQQVEALVRHQNDEATING